MSASRRGQKERKRSRAGSESEHRQHDMLGPEEVKQRRSEAESRGQRERWRETVRDQPCPVSQSTGLHTLAHYPSSGSKSCTDRPAHKYMVPNNGLLNSQFPYNPFLYSHCAQALFLKKCDCCYSALMETWQSWQMVWWPILWNPRKVFLLNAAQVLTKAKTTRTSWMLSVCFTFIAFQSLLARPWGIGHIFRFSVKDWQWIGKGSSEADTLGGKAAPTLEIQNLMHSEDKCMIFGPALTRKHA